MKNLFLFLTFCLPIFLIAQNDEGTIIYNEKTNFKIELPDGMKQFANSIPTGSNSKMQLTFNANESLYKEIPKQEEAPEANEMQSGSLVKITGLNENSLIYHNRAEGIKIESKDFFGKQFLITSTPEKGKWKVTGEQKTVAGYNCFSAEMIEESPKKEGEMITTKAWFAPEISQSIGPGVFQGLPGAFLEVTVEQKNLEITIKAEKITFEKLEKAIEKPSDGKKVTQQEFEEITEKKMKEMTKLYGGKGDRDGKRIRIITN